MKQKATDFDIKARRKRRKLDCGIARQASMEMMPEELQGLPPHYFQSAKAMNVIITKRLADKQQSTV